MSNGNAENAVIEINETLQYPANDDVIEIIDLCATQIPLPNLNFLESHFNSSVIEIFDSPSFLHSNIPTRRPRKRQRAIPYELTPAPSSSQSQLENPITCPICLDNVRNHTPVSTNCGHIFCKQCLIQALKSAKCCPMCKKSITRKNQSHDIFI